MESNTHISFYLTYSRIHVFVDTLREIGSPGRICFLIDKSGTRLVIIPYSKKDFISHGVDAKVYRGNGRMEVCSKPLCNVLAGMHHWDRSFSYRIPGIVSKEKKIATFYLSKAERIERDTALTS